MKKLIIVVIIFFVFLGGITLGGKFNEGTSNFFEDKKVEFERKITDPNGNYENVDLEPNEYGINKTAHKIDNILGDTLKKILKRIAE